MHVCEDDIGKTARWVDKGFRTFALGRPFGNDHEWARALTEVVLPLAARNASSQHCYWALVGFCHGHGYVLFPQWAARTAKFLDMLLSLIRTETDDELPSVRVLNKTIPILLELSIEFAGNRREQWETDFLHHRPRRA